MKRNLIIACFLCIWILQSSAQVTYKPGAKGGVDFSRLTNFNSDFRTGFYLGGQLSIKFNKLYTLQPELMYSQQGANRTYNFDVLNGNTPSNPDPEPSLFYNDIKINYKLDYLCIGVINKFYFGSGFHFVVGPSLDFKVNDNFSNNFYLKEPIGFDFAIVGGFGYSFSNGLSFDARFKQGMVDIFGNNYNTNVDVNGNGNYDEVVLNQSFQLGLSYSFDIK